MSVVTEEPFSDGLELFTEMPIGLQPISHDRAGHLHHVRLRAWRWNQTFVCLRALMFVNGISAEIVTAQPGLTPLTPLAKHPLGLPSALSISLCFAQRGPGRRGG